MDDVDLVRSRADIVQLVSEKVQLKKTGQNWTGLCPFHDDKKPSFTVSPKTGRYKCWSCGASGDCFTWVMETQRMDFREALQWLAASLGITLTPKGKPQEPGKRESMTRLMNLALEFYRESLTKSTDAQNYLEKRGLPTEVINLWELGYAPDANDVLARKIQASGFSFEMAKELFLVDESSSGGSYDKFRGRLMFPIRDERGQLVAFGGRILGDGHPKYINSGDTPLFSKRRVLYGMNQAREALSKSRKAVLVEGYLDVIACHRAGVSTAVASLGTALGEDHARLLKRWVDEVVIFYDADTAGQKAASRAAEVLLEVGLKANIARMPQGADPDTLLRDAGPAAVHQAVESGLDPLDFQLQQLEQKHNPNEPEYWDEVVEMLARTPNALEVEKHLVRLAARYPDLRDPIAAQRALNQQVRVKRRQNRETKKTGFQQTAYTPLKVPLDAREAAVFRACLDEELRPLVWSALAQDDLWVTGLGARLAESLSRSSAEVPEGSATNMLAHLEDPALIEEFVALDVEYSLTLSKDTVLEALKGLQERREKRSLVELRSTNEATDSVLQEFEARMKRLKNVESETNP